MNNLISIVAQAFYGNRTGTEIRKENVDSFILGHIDGNSYKEDIVDRTIISVPNTDNIVIVYNKYEEEKRLNDKKEYFAEDNYELKPVVVIPENNIKLYSRCIVCRMNDNGELDSLKDGDYEKFVNYLAE